jgi:hypothetical protein
MAQQIDSESSNLNHVTTLKPQVFPFPSDSVSKLDAEEELGGWCRQPTWRFSCTSAIGSTLPSHRSAHRKARNGFESRSDCRELAVLFVFGASPRRVEYFVELSRGVNKSSFVIKENKNKKKKKKKKTSEFPRKLNC